MSSLAIIIFSVILSIIYLISLINFKLSLCDSNTRISIICWNIIFIVIIINFFIIGFQKKNIETNKNVNENETEEEIETTKEIEERTREVQLCDKKKTNGTKIFFMIVGIVLFFILCFYIVKKLNLC
jgi:phosphotransferase system  glucose/maltose/N-acetylglucosamine-specific IIC component